MCAFRWIVPLLAVVLLAPLGACIGPDECENTLTLTAGDDGSSHTIVGGCTSLWIELDEAPAGDLEWVEAPTLSEEEVLRFDYFMRGDHGAASYALTPVGNGEVTVEVDRLDATTGDRVDPWSATITVEL